MFKRMIIVFWETIRYPRWMSEIEYMPVGKKGHYRVTRFKPGTGVGNSGEVVYYFKKNERKKI